MNAREGNVEAGAATRPGSAQVTLASVRPGLQPMGGQWYFTMPYPFPILYPCPSTQGQTRENDTMARAYYYASGKNKFLEVQGKRFPVTGMREARKLCKDLNAQPWNF